MEITYINKQIERVCTDCQEARIRYGLRMAKIISRRIGQLSLFNTVEELVKNKIGRCHRLIGHRQGQFAMDLIQPFRLIFTVVGNGIEIANIIEIVDYH